MTKVSAFIKTHRQFVFYSFLVLLIIVIAIAAPVIARTSPTSATLRDAFQAPSSEHWFGTDALGRDVFARVIYGTRVSVSSAVILVAVILVVGTALGLIAGYFGGIVDAVIMRIADMMIAFPELILAMAIAGILGPSLMNAIIAITVVSWTKYARMARSLVLKIRRRTYISAAEISGSTHLHILTSYMLPNALPTMIITAATDIGTMMLSLASLSFLGMGVQPPTPEWGYMLSEGRAYILTSPWLLFFPGAAVFIVVVIFNLWGDSVRDIADPRKKAKKRKHTRRK